MMAKNAEETIGESLETLKAFDEVIVYLNDSTDSTKQIAMAYANVKVIEGEFLGFGKTKNLAVSHSKHDWVLSLDSDEMLNDTLIREIEVLDLNTPNRIYNLKRDNYFLGHKTQDSDVITRIFNKNYTQFNDNSVHEKVIVPSDASVIVLEKSFRHLNITNINQTLTKMIQYTDLSVEDSKTCCFLTVIGKAFFAFFKMYVLKGNFLNGWVGFALGVNAANRRYYKYIKQFIHCQDKKKNIKKNANS